MGSSITLSRRLRDYFNISFLETEIKKNKSMIYKALLKYGYSKFTLEILEYCDSQDLIKREQYYIDLLKPNYNLLKIAGSSLGYKRTEETRAKMSSAKSQKIEVLNIKTGKRTIYGSGKEASNSLGCSRSTIVQCIKKGTLFNKIYKFQKK